MASAWTNGSTRQWRRIRAAVLARDNHICQVRIRGVCTGVATCVHHTLGRAVTGDDPRFLVASCRSCNLRIGEPGRQRRGRRQQRAVQLTLYDRW
jgi:5-methylcytosine-specific restriction endonuclease McrA